MIGSLRGKLLIKTEKYLILETGGVGYKIYASSQALTLTKSKEEIFLFIHTHVREDSIDLYGFADQEELEFFELLLNVPGVGPKSAIAILGITTLSTLKKAISSGDLAYLTKISGIGKKTAEKILIELRDKLDKLGESDSDIVLQGEIDALEALKSLGYSQQEAREALKKVSGGGSTNLKIKEALKILGSR